MAQTKTFLRLIGQQPGEPGRASLYKSEYCQIVRDLAEEGMFPESWCANIGVSLSAMRLWCQAFPEFREAVEIAHLLLVHYWTKKFKEAAESPTAKPGIYAMLARRLPAFYGTAPVDLVDWLLGGPAITGPAPAAPRAAAPAQVGNDTEDDLRKRLAALQARRAAEKGTS